MGRFILLTSFGANMSITRKSFLNLTSLEDRTVPAAFRPIPDNSISLTPDDGGIPRVKIIDPATGEDIAEIQAFEDSFRGGVRAALGDITGDGVDDLAIVPGTGGAPRLRLLDGTTGKTLADFLVYEESFRGGLYVSLGDVTGDGRADIVTGTGNGGAPRVRVLDGASLGASVVRDFFAYEDSFRGGVLVSTGDLDGDGRDDVITGTGVGGGPRVISFSGRDNRVLHNFFAYEDNFRGGVLVSSGDVNGDGIDEIITGTGPGGGPVVRVIDRNGLQLMQFLADDSSFRGGVNVSSSDLDDDGRDDVVTQTRHGNSISVNLFDDSDGRQRGRLNRTVDDNPSASDLSEGNFLANTSPTGVFPRTDDNPSSSDTSNSTTTSGSNTSSSSDALPFTKIEGTITAVSPTDGTVTIRTSSGNLVRIRTNSSTKIERNDLHVTLTAFKVGDRGEAETGSGGMALKVEAVGT